MQRTESCLSTSNKTTVNINNVFTDSLRFGLGISFRQSMVFTDFVVSKIITFYSFKICVLGFMCFICCSLEVSLVYFIFIFNICLRCRGLNTMRVYPWVHTGSNQVTNSNQLQEATFPDQDPSSLPPKAQFTIAAGDFLEVSI